MSHFTCLIVGNNPEEQLKPFAESLKKDFNDYTEEVHKSWKEDTLGEWYADVDATVTKEDYEMLEKEGRLELKDFPPEPMRDYKFIDGNKIKLNYEYPEEIWKDTEHPRWSEYIYAKLSNVQMNKDVKPNTVVYASLEKIEPPKRIPVQDKYASFEEFVDKHHGYELHDDKFGYWHNNEAKWDWVQLGGRWTGMLKLKDGVTGKIGKPGLQTEPASFGYVDSARKCDIDFDCMSEKGIIESGEIYDKFLEKYEQDKECKTFHPLFEYGIKGEMKENIFIPETKEVYVKKSGTFVTFAVLKDGKWFERGEMGWWGITIDEKPNEVWDEEFSKLINELPEETLLSVYDCHI